MKKGILGSVTTGFIIVFALFCVLKCTVRVPTGYVAVVYSMDGGVDDEYLTQGWHVLSPTKKTKIFTVSNEQIVLSKDDREGSSGDDSFAVSTADNANIDISFQMSYRFVENNVCDTYKRFKGMSGDDIVNKRIKTVLKSKISEVTTNYSMMDIYSGNREEINTQLTKKLNKSLGEGFGIEVLDASIIDVHPDKQLKNAIDKRVQAMQEKEQARAEQDAIRVKNETDVMKAEADAKVKLTKAEADAEVKIKEAEAEAKSNKLISESITDKLIRMEEVEARKKHGWIKIQGATTVVTD